MTLTLSTDEELAGYPEDVQRLIRQGEQAAIDRYHYYIDQYSHSERLEGGGVVHYSKDGRIMDQGAFHSWFGLSYASWLVLPRVALQEMPLDWQARFVALLEEGEARGLKVPDGLVVQRQIKGKFVSNEHWNNYRRGTTLQAEATDKERGHSD